MKIKFQYEKWSMGVWYYFGGGESVRAMMCHCTFFENWAMGLNLRAVKELYWGLEIK